MGHPSTASEMITWYISGIRVTQRGSDTPALIPTTSTKLMVARGSNLQTPNDKPPPAMGAVFLLQKMRCRTCKCITSIPHLTHKRNLLDLSKRGFGHRRNTTSINHKSGNRSGNGFGDAVMKFFIKVLSALIVMLISILITGWLVHFGLNWSLPVVGPLMSASLCVFGIALATWLWVKICARIAFKDWYLL